MCSIIRDLNVTIKITVNTSLSESRSIVSDFLQPHGYTAHGIFQARILEWVAFPFSRESSHPGTELRSPTLQVDSLPANHKGSPRILEWVAYPFSRGSSQPRARNQVSHVAGRFFTSWATREALCHHTHIESNFPSYVSVSMIKWTHTSLAQGLLLSLWKNWD